ncbi:MAG: type II toxin-antitoxin system VapC family toxin [Desulfobacterales bacterium]|jgi:tRNA(fMet)-specific endonuclease VapC
MLRMLDTNTCIYYLNQISDNLLSQFKKYSPSEVKLSSITVAELYYGAEKSKAKNKNLATTENFISTFDIIPFDEASSRTYAKIRATLEKKGTPIGPMDLLIASICMTYNLILVTNNTGEFSRISKLRLENWI